MRAAFSKIVLNTGRSSPGELDIISSTSDVAVCCSRASAQLARARLQIFDKACVFDCNRRLIGEGRNKIDLALSEGLDTRPRQDEHAHRLALI